MPNHTQVKIAAVARTPETLEHIVVMERLQCYNHGLPCGANALHRHLQKKNLCPLPSVWRISQILTRYGLTHGRTGWYEGEQRGWQPASTRVPEARRKHFSLTDYRDR